MEESVFVWLNDKLLPLGEARVSVNDRGFLYGDGFFETLRAEAGRVRFLGEHLARLKNSARAFRLPFPEGLPWEETLDALLTANNLQTGLAAVKILLSRGVAPTLGLPDTSNPTLVIWARPYTPPREAEYRDGWPVVIFPEHRSTFLGRHKSLNYLFYLSARQYALDQGVREALILESDGLVSEGAATSLVFTKADRFYTPLAASALPGVTIAVLSRALVRQGKRLEPVPTSLSQLQQANGLWLANSLMGLMPVNFLDRHPLPISPQTNQFLQNCLTSEVG
ncbi:MAG: aminotransferase class IV [Thermodesulfobacteriota bacterium]